MADGGGGAPSSSSDFAAANNRRSSPSSSSAPLDGAFLLHLLRNPPQSHHHHHNSHPHRQSESQHPQQPSHRPLSFLPHETLNPHRDPAVAAVGPPTYHHLPTHSLLRPAPPQGPAFGGPLRHQDLDHSSPPLRSNLPPPPGFSPSDRWAPPPGFPPPQLSSSPAAGSPPLFRGNLLSNPSSQQRRGSSRPHSGISADGNLGTAESGRFCQEPNSAHPKTHFSRNHYPGGPSGGKHQNALAQQPASAAAAHNRRPAEWVVAKQRQDGRLGNVEREGNGPSSFEKEFSAGRGGPGTSDVRSSLHFQQSVGAAGRRDGFFEESSIERVIHLRDDFGSGRGGSRDSDDVAAQLEELAIIGEDASPTTENNEARHSNSSRGKDVRIDLFRGHYVSSQRVRIRRRELECRYDIDSVTPLFLAIYKSLTPAAEEIGKQKQLLDSLGKLVNREWPDAQLHLYGSCANSFGVSNSDIDLCLAIDDSKMSKSEILLTLAEILEADNLQNVQALTHARVPIVKMMDPVTGISCDICINNLLAVANTKLLRDYAQIDDRLRQLAFIVKHWAKSRGVNETYRGTLSSYAYVLMCIHFLQQRRPAILPCLQEMEATYVVNIDGTQCAYFDQVDRLHNFGAQNHESIARLIWGFFHYWAYYHDYTNDVISVRTGRNISKRLKDWTRRIGNDRHLICIEDPFETSHDLGRVVDKFSIKILREEFERAADILQYDPNPSITLFEPYVARSLPNGLQSAD